MSQYDILYACGHTGTVRLYGPETTRQRKIAWLRTVDCPRCAREHATPQIDIWIGPWDYLDTNQPPVHRPAKPLHLVRIVVDVTHGYPIREHLKSRHYRYLPEPIDGVGAPKALGLLSMQPPTPIWRKQWGVDTVEEGRRAYHDIAMEMLDLRRIAGLPRSAVRSQDQAGLRLQMLFRGIPRQNQES